MIYFVKIAFQAHASYIRLNVAFGFVWLMCFQSNNIILIINALLFFSYIPVTWAIILIINELLRKNRLLITCQLHKIILNRECCFWFFDWCVFSQIALRLLLMRCRFINTCQSHASHMINNFHYQDYTILKPPFRQMSVT